PLRHYAEVHLLLELSEPGSGLTFASDVSEDVLSKNWQRLILTHLSEKEHMGVLTGSPVTDMKITLVNGKAHIKHTEGGDFRQATYRAVRHGLMKAESVLLEPYYSFTLLVPSENVGRALTDLDGMKAQFKPPVMEGSDAVITGIAPVLLLNEYQKEFRGYTHGKGSISLEFYGYLPCHNTEEVISEIGYNPELDTDNPCSSVFCAHGAGFVVDWTMVEDYMHLPNISDDDNSEAPFMMETMPQSRSFESDIHEKYQKISYSDDRELQEIFRRTYGEAKRKTKEAVVYGKETQRSVTYEKKEKLKEYLLVDGYNVIHANPELETLLKDNLEASRSVLMDVLCNYQGYRDYEVILVFDAYRVKGNPGDVIKYHNISVVYTKEAETADRYIERTAHEIAHKYNVTVVTSDGVEQVIIRGAGCNLMSSRDFWDDVKRLAGEIHETIDKKVRNRPLKERNYLFDYLDDETFKIIEDIRLKG
ncbi:MAG: NYN domain-containing protein, partial [Lachnospiraceae bacterium]